MRRLLAIVVLVGLFAVPVLGIRAFLDPVPVERLQRLRKGMTQDQVRQVLGEPTTICAGGQWIYQRPLVFGFVNIQMGADGIYPGEYNYERF
jgi:hypothetical protein